MNSSFLKRVTNWQNFRYIYQGKKKEDSDNIINRRGSITTDTEIQRIPRRLQ